MKVIVTGASGFLGARVVDALLRHDALHVTAVVACDVRAPPAHRDPRVQCRALDLGALGAAAALIAPDTAVVLHLAAIVSGEAERDFDLGMRVNLDGTRALLEAVRHAAPGARFVFASTTAVFGCEPSVAKSIVVDERTAPTPRTSYGAAKAAAELLVCEYSRRGFVDGVAVRLPCVTVRAGAPNAAVTGFASGVVREPLRGEPCVVPVPADTELWVSSPRAVVANLVHAAHATLPEWRALCLPGLRVSVTEMVSALRRVGGEAAARLVSYRPEAEATRMVTSFPAEFDTSLALSLGFERDVDFEGIVRDYMRECGLPPLS